MRSIALTDALIFIGEGLLGASISEEALNFFFYLSDAVGLASSSDDSDADCTLLSGTTLRPALVQTAVV